MSNYGITISHETLYQYIYKKDITLGKYLLRRKYGRKPRKRHLYKPNNPKNIPNRTDIDLREELANLRMEFGHYECDTVESCKKRGKTKPCLPVLIERMSRKVIINKEVYITFSIQHVIGGRRHYVINNAAQIGICCTNNLRANNT